MGESPILPITASADGRMNMYFSQCRVTSQVVNYAACLWRQEVLSNPKTKVPADWNQCGEAAKCGRCMAVDMRHEEVLQGRAIYFRGRTTDKTIKQEAMVINPPGYWKQVDDTVGNARREKRVSAPEARVVTSKPATTKPVASASIFDTMTGGTDYAAALNAMTSAPTPAPAPAPAPTLAPEPAPVKPVAAAPVAPVALPGESPLAMARRLAAQRKSATT